MSKSFIASRSILLDGRMYQKGEVIECPLTRGRAKLFLSTKAIEEVVKPEIVLDESPTVSIARNSVRPSKPKRAKV